jgi:hypothetical protein
MLEILSHKVAAGDLYVSLAQRHLANHEWGQARIAIEKGIAKGRLSDSRQAGKLLRDICHRLGIDPGSVSALGSADEFTRE